MEEELYVEHMMYSQAWFRLACSLSLQLQPACLRPARPVSTAAVVSGLWAQLRSSALRGEEVVALVPVH